MHIVYLSDPVVRELEALNAESEPGCDFVFTTTGKTPVSGFSKLKTRLNCLVDLSDWRLHDIRTAFASALCELGEPEGVVDRVLSHMASGSAPSAVARVYNQSEYLNQRAGALSRWADLIVAQTTIETELHD